MLIVLTGKTSVGKTTLIQAIKNDFNIIEIDRYVKNKLYISNHPVFELIKKAFPECIINSKIDTSILGFIVFNNEEKLNKLNNIVFPYIKKYLLSFPTKDIYIVELAIYINHENKYKNLFNKVILLTRHQKYLKQKFKYMPSDFNPISNNKIQYDCLIQNNSTIDDARKKILLYLKNL